MIRIHAHDDHNNHLGYIDFDDSENRINERQALEHAFSYFSAHEKVSNQFRTRASRLSSPNRFAISLTLVMTVEYL